MPISKKLVEEQISQQQQMQVNEKALQDISAVAESTKQLEQEMLNKSHDTEMNPSANGQIENYGVIGQNEVREAYQTLLDYKKNKAELEQRLTEHEMFWRMSHWDVVKENQGAKSEQKSDRIKPKSAWLVNTILNKHADAMDNYPEPNILPRAADDEEVAKILSKVVPVILEQNDYQRTYSNEVWDKNKFGTSIQGAFSVCFTPPR